GDSSLFPSTPPFRPAEIAAADRAGGGRGESRESGVELHARRDDVAECLVLRERRSRDRPSGGQARDAVRDLDIESAELVPPVGRSEEHTSELQSREN